MKNILALSILLGLLSSGCTQQNRAKNFGGSMVEVLPVGKKLINVTWKETHLWLLTRPMTATDTAETYEFIESSTWGILNGKVIITERK